MEMVSLVSTLENLILHPGLGLALIWLYLQTNCTPSSHSSESQLYMVSYGNYHHRHQGESLPHLSSLLQPKGFDFFAHESIHPCFWIQQSHVTCSAVYRGTNLKLLTSQQPVVKFVPIWHMKALLGPSLTKFHSYVFLPVKSLLLP